MDLKSSFLEKFHHRISENRSAKTLFVLIICLAVIFILFPYRDIAPLWDTRWYWHLCILPSLEKVFDLMAFNCSNHPNMAFFLPLGMMARFTSLDPLRAHQIIAILFSSLAIWLYLRTLIILKGHKSPGASDFLNVAAFAMSPIYLANLVNLSPEVGSVTYMLGFLFGFLSGRIWTMAFFGAAMVFTKEPFIVVYGLTSAYFFYTMLANNKWQKSSILPAVKHCLPLIIPGFLLLSYAFFRVYYYKMQLFHGSDGSDSRVGGIETLFSFNFDSQNVITVLIQTYVASFMWISLIVMALWVIKAFYKRYFGRIPLPTGDAIIGIKTHFFVFYVIVFYALTRVVPVVNPRYLMALIPLTLMMMALALGDLTKNKSLKISIHLAFLCLLYMSQTRTFDPLSKGMLGTFNFGQHQILHMTKRSGSCCGKGLDPLVYNLEFTHLVSLQNKIFAEIKPNSDTVIAYHQDVNYFPSGNLDPSTYKNVLRNTNLHPKYTAHNEILESIDSFPEIYFIDLPNADGRKVIKAFKSHYNHIERYDVSEDGYRIRYYKFKKLTGPQS